MPRSMYLSESDDLGEPSDTLCEGEDPRDSEWEFSPEFMKFQQDAADLQYERMLQERGQTEEEFLAEMEYYTA